MSRVDDLAAAGDAPDRTRYGPLADYLADFWLWAALQRDQQLTDAELDAATSAALEHLGRRDLVDPVRRLTGGGVTAYLTASGEDRAWLR